MKFQEALRAIPRRLQHPLLLGISLAYFAFLILMLLVSRLVLHQVAASVPSPLGVAPTVANLLKMATSTLVGTLLLFTTTPFPWQWSGDDRRMCPPWRAIPQFVLYFALVEGFIFWMTWEVQKASLQMVEKSLPGTDLRLLLLPGLLMGVVFQCLLGFALALWERRKADKAEAEQQAEEARWTLLKAQMSPHVLLNSLNGLAELVREDTAAAVKGMRDLAEIYGQLLALGEAPTVPLGQERSLLERYLSVEQLRLGERLSVEWHWEEGLDELPVMPLLLQPLVENAIKHGAAANPQGGLVRISARRDGARLRLAVANTGTSPAPSAPKRSGGVGLRNLKSRLEMAYHGRAAFDLVKEAPWIKAELDLPFPEIEP